VNVLEWEGSFPPTPPNCKELSTYLKAHMCFSCILFTDKLLYLAYIVCKVVYPHPLASAEALQSCMRRTSLAEFVLLLENACTTTISATAIISNHTPHTKPNMMRIETVNERTTQLLVCSVIAADSLCSLPYNTLQSFLIPPHSLYKALIQAPIHP
jgi:hypothetical protein